MILINDIAINEKCIWYEKFLENTIYKLKKKIVEPEEPCIFEINHSVAKKKKKK